MRNLIIFFLIVTSAFAKECYFNKVNEICFLKYFDRGSIYQAKADENYYVDKQSRIYSFDNIIEVKFHSIGAIFTILNDYELEFVDKIKKSTYLFKVSHRRDLFPILSKLNGLKSVMKAQPHKTRKYTNNYINRKQVAKKARLKEVLKTAEKRLDAKENEKGKGSSMGGGTIKGNFLNPDAN